jgi:hypothetical protein
MAMSKITDLIAELDILEANQAEMAKAAEELRGQIMAEIKTEGLIQVKTPNATVSVAKRVSQQVNEIEWRKWAVEQPDISLDMFYVSSLDKKKVVDYAQRTLKEDGELVPGITTTETEYLSIRKAK